MRAAPLTIIRSSGVNALLEITIAQRNLSTMTGVTAAGGRFDFTCSAFSASGKMGILEADFVFYNARM